MKLKRRDALSCSPDVCTTNDDEGDEVLDETEKVLVDLEQVEIDVKQSEGEVMSGKALEQLDSVRNNVLGLHEGWLAHVLERV